MPVRHKRLAALCTGVLALVLLLTVYLRGTSGLYLPAVEGYAGLRVSSVSSNGRTAPCTAAWWRGAYVCEESRAVIEGGLGGDDVRDDAGEYAYLWPGTKVFIAKSQGTVELLYPRVRSGPGGLSIEVSTNGKFHLNVSADDIAVTSQDVQGRATYLVPVSHGPAVRDIKLRIEALTDSGQLTLRSH